jgi:hypothetical protein
MLPRARNRFLDEEGSALVLTAVVMVGLLAMASLAVDIGMAITARNEAQRVADACALAGASAFIDPEVADPVTAASDRAYEYALRNVVRNVGVDSSQVTLEILQAESKVRCWISARGLPTWFATFLGIDGLDVQAMAAAEASDGGSGKCLLPFWGLDLWDETEGDTGEFPRIPENGEIWEYEPGPDHYTQSDPETGTGTGFGSDFRTDLPGPTGSYWRDFGRPIVIKTGSVGNTKDDNPGGLETMVAPGNFLLWRLPDPDRGCETEGSGGSFLLENMLQCNPCEVDVGETYSAEPEPGQTWGKVREGMDSLMARETRHLSFDPNAADGKGAIVDEYGSIVTESPLIVDIALADPHQPAFLNGASTDIVFNNIAEVFLENYSQKDKTIYARFLGYSYGGAGSPTGSLIKHLRLVE